MLIREAVILTLVGAMAVLCHGCGGTGSGERAAGGSASVLPRPAAHVANALCLRGHRRMLARVQGAKDAAEAALPVLEGTIVHIARTAPATAEARLSSFVLEFEDVVHTNEGTSITLSRLQAKFKRSDALARRIGLGACTIG